MSEEKVFNRWIVVLGAILIQLALGTIYCWGTLTIFVSPFLKMAATDTVYIFGVGLLSFAVTMIFAGQLQQKIGPMKTAILGGIILGIGVISSAGMTTMAGMLVTYGIIFGAGIGFGYVCPIATAVKWFPDKKGLINGLAVAGFGAGAFIFNYVIKALANPDGIETNASNFAAETSKNVPTLFIALGIIYMIMVIVGAMTMKIPPANYKVPGWTPPPAVAGVTSGMDMTRDAVIKTQTFWILWLMFVLSAISGLMILGSYASFAKSVDEDGKFLYVIGTTDFVLLGSIMALFNGLGRIFWGKMADAITYKKSMLFMFGIQGVLMLIYFSSNSNEALFWILSCALIFCFGGNFSLFPTATTDLFGAKNLGPNYGVVFTAYGIAGFVGAVLVKPIVTAFGSYLALFIVMGLMSLVSAALIFIIKPPKA